MVVEGGALTFDSTAAGGTQGLTFPRMPPHTRGVRRRRRRRRERPNRRAKRPQTKRMKGGWKPLMCRAKRAKDGARTMCSKAGMGVRPGDRGCEGEGLKMGGSGALQPQLLQNTAGQWAPVAWPTLLIGQPPSTLSARCPRAMNRQPVNRLAVAQSLACATYGARAGASSQACRRASPKAERPAVQLCGALCPRPRA